MKAGLMGLFHRLPDFDVVYAGASVESLLSSGITSDVTVLDLRLEGTSGPDAVRQLDEAGHQVLAFTAYPAEYLVPALRAGARGFLDKGAELDELVRATREVAMGGSHISPQLAALLLKEPMALSQRETEVLSLLAEGDTDKDIAEQLGLSVKTVRSYLDRIREKTGARRRPELTRLAIESGITPSPRPAGKGPRSSD